MQDGRMKIFVTGATGVVGVHLVPSLVAGGYDVTAIGRTPASRERLARAGVKAIGLDLFDRAAVRRAVNGQDVIVNLATHMPASVAHMMLPWAWRENDRLRRDAPNMLVDAAIEGGAVRFIQESFAPIYEDRGDQWIDEQTPVRPAAYNRTILDAELAAERFSVSGGKGIVLRFGAFYGPDAMTAQMLKVVRRGWSPLPGRPEAYFSSIAHADAASAALAALQLPAGVYNVVDDEPLRRREWVDALARAVDAPPPRFAPPWTARLMGSVGECLSRSQRISNAKLRASSSWRPALPSVRTGWPVTIAALRHPGAPRVHVA
jgi:nucleoside-diphosphate-sugar epimerase